MEGSPAPRRTNGGLTDRILEAIALRGPLSFAEFMELALYGPGGFYEAPVVGEGGHFVTSPHVHPVFGRLLTGALRSLWDLLGRPEPFQIVEVGAGDGTLAAQLLEGLDGMPVRYVAVERSESARRRLSHLRVEVAADVSQLPPMAGCVVANELLDNLPFHRVRATANGPVEIRVGSSGGRLVEVQAPCPRELAPAAARLRPGEEAVVSLEAISFITRLATLLDRGYALLIDYAEEGGAATGSVHGYRFHREVHDVLAAPGTSDITAGVDFAALVQHAGRVGLSSFGPVTQRAALLALGFGTWSEEERRRQGTLLEQGSGLEAVRTWGARSRASLLVDPARLGALQWLLLATPPLPEPAWLRDAERRDQEAGPLA